MWVTSSTANALKPNCVALGNFDGIHRGHCRVLEPILHPSPGQATVVTFSPHPREFFSGQRRKLLTPLPEKVRLLEKLGMNQLVLLPFNRELAALSPQQFVEEILIRQLQTLAISVGEDFRFGSQRAGTAIDLKAIAAQYGVEVQITSLHCLEPSSQVRISSSLIRQALEQGELATANQMLGRPYSLAGTVVPGQKLGRTIGFPTANVALPTEKFLPRFGVYGVRVFLEGPPETSFASPLNGVMNLGRRPTVQGTSPTAEVHLLNWSGNLYGRSLRICLEKFLRPEQKFPSLEALKTQIARDCQAARENLG
ncbi:MAG: bifunctional riboflavin kinase/FAD synthetase [Cyanophyceae cyanobacterium]